jgi:hypothetical protein
MDGLSAAAAAPAAVTSTAGSGNPPVTAQSLFDQFLPGFAVQTGQSQALETQQTDARLEQRRQEGKQESGEA